VGIVRRITSTADELKRTRFRGVPRQTATEMLNGRQNHNRRPGTGGLRVSGAAPAPL
jgi:hypothetical protein